jgi:hypothetical protein
MLTQTNGEQQQLSGSFSPGFDQYDGYGSEWNMDMIESNLGASSEFGVWGAVGKT